MKKSLNTDFSITTKPLKGKTYELRDWIKKPGLAWL